MGTNGGLAIARIVGAWKAAQARRAPSFAVLYADRWLNLSVHVDCLHDPVAAPGSMTR